jgi:cytidylate kinase
VIIALDGPSAAGKGAIGQIIAKKLDYAYLDTGLLFRAVAHKSVKASVPLDAPARLADLAATISPYDLENPELRSEQIGQIASLISTFPDVRQAITAYEHEFGNHPPEGKKGALLDGRDIGTIIFPEAKIKIFITADTETRARRRHNQLLEMGQKSIYDVVLSDMRARDQRDQTRNVAPLVPAEDAFIVDTTNLTIEEAVEKILSYIAHVNQS